MHQSNNIIRSTIDMYSYILLRDPTSSCTAAEKRSYILVLCITRTPNTCTSITYALDEITRSHPRLSSPSMVDLPMNDLVSQTGNVCPASSTRNFRKTGAIKSLYLTEDCFFFRMSLC